MGLYFDHKIPGKDQPTMVYIPPSAFGPDVTWENLNVTVTAGTYKTHARNPNMLGLSSQRPRVRRCGWGGAGAGQGQEQGRSRG